MGEAKTPREMYRRLSGGGGRKEDSRLPPPLVPVDFGYWKLAPAGLGLLGLGVYAGFRKQVSRRTYYMCHPADRLGDSCGVWHHDVPM